MIHALDGPLQKQKNIDKIGKLIREYRGLAEITGIYKKHVRQMSKLLTHEQKESRMNICSQGEQIQIQSDDGLFWCSRHCLRSPEGQTVNQYYYIEVLTALHERVRKQRPDLWKTKSWKIHQDNALVCSALSLKGIFAKHGITVLVHPPYSPDLTLYEFFTKLESVEAVKAKTTKVLKQLTEANFQHYFQHKSPMEWCRDHQGEYTEGEKIATVIGN